MSRPPSTPGVKSEPRDSPLLTPHSAGAAHLDMGLRRGRSDDGQGRSASPRVRDINLGQSLFKRARPDSPAEISSSKYKATSGRPERLAIDLSQDIDDEDYDPFAYRPEFEKGNKLRFDELDEDQKRVVELAIRGRKNICCVGGAGTGKSQTCEMIVDGYSDARVRIAIVAPSGTAAVNVKAQTLHSFFGLGASTNKGIEELISSMKRNVRERIDNTDVLVIDEISMVSNETFDRMDQLARVARDEPEKPFGGMQIIVFGDFCQLPPVKPHEHCYQCGKKRELVTLPKRKRGKTGQRVWRCTEHGDILEGDKMWAFKSARWDTTGFEYIQLTHVHRQQDPTFLNILANVRFGKPFTPVEVDLLTNHDCDVKNAVELTAKRVEAGKINDERLKRLPAVEHEYECQDDFDWQEDLHPELDHVYQNKRRALWEHPYEVIVRLKQNEPVILQRNMNVRKGLVNGSQGVIQHFVDYDEVHHQHDRSLEDDNIGPDRFKHVKDFMKSQRRAGLSTVLPVVKFNNYPDLVTVYPDCSVTELGFKKPPSLLTRTQVPLLAGWALTIHKAQGMTLEKAIVDLADCFQCGMAYVALSRVKTLAGLKVKGLRQSTMVHAVDEEVRGFMQLHFGADFD